MDVVCERPRQAVVGDMMAQVEDRVADLSDERLISSRRLSASRRSWVSDETDTISSTMYPSATSSWATPSCISRAIRLRSSAVASRRTSSNKTAVSRRRANSSEIACASARASSSQGSGRRRTTLPSWCPAPRRPTTKTSSFCARDSPRRRGWRASWCRRAQPSVPGADPRRIRKPRRPLPRSLGTIYRRVRLRASRCRGRPRHDWPGHATGSSADESPRTVLVVAPDCGCCGSVHLPGRRCPGRRPSQKAARLERVEGRGTGDRLAPTATAAADRRKALLAESQPCRMPATRGGTDR